MMRIIADLAEVDGHEPAFLAISAFDGVHQGHQALVRRTAALAAAGGALAVAVTCWPHPLSWWHPEQPVHLLTTREERRALLGALGGLDALLDLTLTRELAEGGPAAYPALLRDRFQIQGLLTGPSFAKRPAEREAMGALEDASAPRDNPVEVVQLEAAGKPISSTRIRALLNAGAVAEAATLLGRRHTVTGVVIEGDKRGRLIGFPTANLQLDPIKLVPANGVYAVRAQLRGSSAAARPGVANIGVRPTFGSGNTWLVEVYLLDTSMDLYGQELEVEFVARLREERRFPGVDALVEQIRADVDQARTLLAATGPAQAPEEPRR